MTDTTELSGLRRQILMVVLSPQVREQLKEEAKTCSVSYRGYKPCRMRLKPC